MSRLIVGCGINYQKQDGDVTVDILPSPNVDLVKDLNKPWSIVHNTYDEVVAIHVVEHLQSLIHFMNEAWDVLKPGGILHIETPLAGGNPELEWADPTHVRCFTCFSFINYFTPEGIANFGYTDKAWNIHECTTICLNPHLWGRNDTVVFKGTPLK